MTFAERANEAFWEERGGLSVRLDHAKEAYLVETMLEITGKVTPSLRSRKRREQLYELMREFSWSSLANPFVPAKCCKNHVIAMIAVVASLPPVWSGSIELLFNTECIDILRTESRTAIT
ncbi:hypothetical protein [Haladaptatus halobius]|uniref:hypothetical protein n=1 Tax=Haladaptatus halobius TaxID=2884875 RepID=UPI001D0B68C0|nr:hypothetical protein [Haladaptatus halobius]